MQHESSNLVLNIFAFCLFVAPVVGYGVVQIIAHCIFPTSKFWNRFKDSSF